MNFYLSVPLQKHTSKLYIEFRKLVCFQMQILPLSNNYNLPYSIKIPFSNSTYIHSMLSSGTYIGIEFDLYSIDVSFFDVKIGSIHLHRKPIRRLVFSVIGFYEDFLSQMQRLRPLGYCATLIV